MSKLLYLDCFSGISGDMFLGACIDLGIDPGDLNRELAKLHLDGYRLVAEPVKKNGICATKATVILENEESHPHRHLEDIIEILAKSELSGEIKAAAVKVFERLAEAEAKVHGTTRDKVHFHEVGAVDAIVDIVGAVICLDKLGVEKVLCSPLNVGYGYVHCRHGIIPVPAPATMELLKGIPVYSLGDALEMVTPTGAAIVSTLAHGFGRLPRVVVEKIGYGAGEKEHGIPNLLRIMLCRLYGG